MIRFDKLKIITNIKYISNINDKALKECSFNLAEVEAKIRALSSTNTVISRRIRPYKQLLNNLSDPTFSLSKLQKLVSLV